MRDLVIPLLFRWRRQRHFETVGRNAKERVHVKTESEITSRDKNAPMADPKNPLKPVEIRGTPLSEDAKRVPPSSNADPGKSPQRARAKLHVVGKASSSVIKVTEDRVDISLEQAYAEALKAEETPEFQAPRPSPPRMTGAPPPASTMKAAHTTAPPPAIPSPSSRAPGVSTRSAFRRPCSFPGMLRVLLPEQSFEPQVFAVRVMEISSTGARVETLQLTEELHRIISLEVRYIRLEILIPTRDRLILSGKLAWMEFSPETSVIGLSFVPQRDDLASIIMPDWQPQGTNDSAFISPPVIDSYPPTTTRTPFTFTGHALDADSIVVRGKSEEYRVPVVSGRFEVTVPLVPGSANELIFVALVGEMASDPTPVWIIHRAGAEETINRRSVGGLFQDAVVSKHGRSLHLKFKGDGRDFVQALRRLEETASHGESFELSLEMTGEAERALGALKKGGRFPWGKDSQ